MGGAPGFVVYTMVCMAKTVDIYVSVSDNLLVSSVELDDVTSRSVGTTLRDFASVVLAGFTLGSADVVRVFRSTDKSVVSVVSDYASARKEFISSLVELVGSAGDAVSSLVESGFSVKDAALLLGVPSHVAEAVSVDGFEADNSVVSLDAEGVAGVAPVDIADDSVLVGRWVRDGDSLVADKDVAFSDRYLNAGVTSLWKRAFPVVDDSSAGDDADSVEDDAVEGEGSSSESVSGGEPENDDTVEGSGSDDFYDEQ